MANLTSNLTALQLHVQFWDANNDSIITPYEIYAGFRALGFSIIFSLGGLLIPLFFSYPTTLGHSWLPDPLFRIFTSDIHKAKHGSDSSVYDPEGNARWELFDEVFEKMDSSLVHEVGQNEEGEASSDDHDRKQRSLGVEDLMRLHARNRNAADPAGWSFAAMEWWTTWLLLQRQGRVWEEDLKGLYDGTLFWKIRDERIKEGGRQGYGWRDWLEGMRAHGTWRTWDVDKTVVKPDRVPAIANATIGEL